MVKKLVAFFKSLTSLALKEGKFSTTLFFFVVDKVNKLYFIITMIRNRTKASAAQQKEANMINMSLMQLWRCLQMMKRKVEIIQLFYTLSITFTNYYLECN